MDPHVLGTAAVLPEHYVDQETLIAAFRDAWAEKHFNADTKQPARLISCINRIYKNSGLNDLEQIEDAPEYDANVVLTAELVREYIAKARKATA